MRAKRERRELFRLPSSSLIDVTSSPTANPRGGKAVMAYALNKELNGNLRNLISIDMTPAIGKVAPA